MASSQPFPGEFEVDRNPADMTSPCPALAGTFTFGTVPLDWVRTDRAGERLNQLRAEFVALLASVGATKTVISESMAAGRVDAPTRLSLGLTLQGVDDKTCAERVYLISPASYGGKRVFRLERVCDIQWTAGTQTAATAAGHLSSHVHPKSAAITADTSLLAGRTGALPRGQLAVDRATVEIADVGSGVVGVLRAFQLSGGFEATAIRPYSKWWH